VERLSAAPPLLLDGVESSEQRTTPHAQGFTQSTKDGRAESTDESPALGAGEQSSGDHEHGPEAEEADVP
jgi:hypothetical protein